MYTPRSDYVPPASAPEGSGSAQPRPGIAAADFLRYGAAPAPLTPPRNDTAPGPVRPLPEEERQRAEPPSRGAALMAEITGLDPFTAMGWVFSRWKLVLAFAALGALAAALFAVLVPPRYTTYVDMLLDPASVQVLSDDLFVQSTLQDALLLQVESKMRYLTSTSVLSAVVERLDLARDPEFVGDAGGWSLLGSLFPAAADGADDSRLVALRQLYEQVGAQREERSFIVTLRVATRHPEKSVTIANAVVDAFKAELNAADSQRASAAAEALNTQLTELRADVMAAEAAVEVFRRENGLQTSAGELVSSQSLAQFNSQLLDARTRAIQAQARYDELSGIDVEGLSAADVIDSEVLAGLRTQYATLRQEIDAQSATLGPRHPSIARLQPQLAAVTREIEREIARRVQAAATELTEAEMVTARLTNEIARARETVASDNAAQVQLRELERDAAARAAIYEAFLTRTGEIAQREQIDTTNIRVISPAIPPAQRDYPPRTVVLLALGAIAGGLAGMGAALLLGFAGKAWPRLMRATPAPAAPQGSRTAP